MCRVHFYSRGPGGTALSRLTGIWAEGGKLVEDYLQYADLRKMNSLAEAKDDNGDGDRAEAHPDEYCVGPAQLLDEQLSTT